MKLKKKLKKNFILGVLFLLLLIIGIGSFLGPDSFSSFVEIENVWSGDVATSFSGGNGTSDNPYQISNGEELAYFKSVIESDDDDLYKEKYYVLTSDINMGGLSLDSIGNDENIFSGSFDGQGYAITNLVIDGSERIDDNYYLGLFVYVEDATIENINFDSLSIEVDLTSNLYLGLISGEMNESTIENISIMESSIVLVGTEDYSNVYIGGVSGSENDSSISYSYLDIDITSDVDLENIGSVIGISNSTDDILNNILVVSNLDNYISNKENSSNVYDDTTVPDTFLDTLNSSLTTDNFYWVNDESAYYLQRIEEDEEDEDSTSNIQTSIITSNTVKAIEEHTSGVDGSTVYINDLESDYYYYIGLNYTYSSDSKLPTTSNKEIYDDSNLVSVQITYDGKMTRDGETYTGYVSTTERVSKYIYYKTYAVNDNGTSSDTSDDYIEIELIDNPFTDRPTGYGFNGWITSYYGAEISYDSSIYVRYATVPVSYTDGVPDDIVIDFTANWTPADVQIISSNSTSALTTAISSFNDTGMQMLATKTTAYSIEGYYYLVSLSRNEAYPENSYNQNGNAITASTCSSWGGCSAYVKVTDEEYDSSYTYYTLVNGKMTAVSASDLLVTAYEKITYSDDTNMSGYYIAVTISYGSSYTGYYSSTGVYQSSGTCTTSSGCTYYELLQYYDESNNQNTFDEDETYYYLVTRDTNIMVLETNLSSSWGSSQTKPLTFTGSYGGTQYSVTWTLSNTYVSAGDDLVIENMTITSNNNNGETSISNRNSQNNYFYGNWYNVKLGRGITRSGSYTTFAVAEGGNNSQTGSSSSLTEYRFMVESGYYNVLSLTGGSETGKDVYINGEGIYGNDYDRVTGNNNNLDIYYCASGSWGNNIRSTSGTAIAMHTTVKSGKFGSRRPTSGGNYYYTYGIYIGGRNYGGNYAAREITVEGGWIYNLIGGPLSQSSNSSYNDTYMYIKGGQIDAIFGGAGRSETYGNRIIQITGGTINYSVFGGSNGITSGDNEGTLTGTPYIYIGGTASIGNSDSSYYGTYGSTLWGAESGSIFGIGNGTSGSSSIGSANNSYIVINGGTILNNIYGGGNYGAVGNSGSTTTTEIDVLDGIVKGSIFGGGNRNGSGSSSITSTITINMYGGMVTGSIYGGSNETGTIYGGVNINFYGGTISTDIYGGGYGGLSNSSDGTFVRDAISIVVGDTNDSFTPTIEGSIYGGSAYGSVNGTSNTTTISSNGVDVTVNEGTIKTAVFGGGKGNSTYTPYVMGNIVVTINGGNIASVYGGNDAAGVPNGTIDIYINDGTVGDVFGGGNNASVNTNNIYMNGGIVTRIFGGSNASGTVTESNILVTDGTVSTVYGGNNTGGDTVTSNVTIDGGTINVAVYGGGYQASTATTNVILNGTYIPAVYGGGENADVTTITNVTLNGSMVGSIYGGSNAGGTVAKTNVVLNSGIATNVFGGNNEGGSTAYTSIKMNNGVYGNIYGGGNQVGVTTTNVTLVNGTADNVYGGSNQSGEVTTANITTSEETIDSSLEMSVTATDLGYSIGTTSASTITVTIDNNSSADLTEWNAYILTTDSVLYTNYSGYLVTSSGSMYSIDETNQWYGTNTLYSGSSYSFSFITGNSTEYDDFEILGYYIIGYDSSGNSYYSSSSSLNVGSVYGGNNEGGTTVTTDVTLDNGEFGDVYGGGNQAVNTGDATTSIDGATITGSVYGGGNQAAVYGNTILNINGDTTIGGNAFGGGNHGAVGTSSASRTSTVNISGADISGNVYGGCNTSVVYGTVSLNIGKSAISDNDDFTISDITIGGTVFGGGEANEAGSETYDFSFISVTEGITINIDGTDYDDVTFKISGSIFGSGNASSSSGDSIIYIKKLGTRDNPNTCISIQRANVVTIDESAIELTGTTDRTNEYSSIKYSLNRIDQLKLKNSATLLLQQNANLLKEFSSLVDVDGEEVKATVTIEDGVVTKNTDNRLYMLANKNLNVTTNEAATDYGNVYGMTFLGMYLTSSSGTYVYGIYDEDMDASSSVSVSDVITGGSYVLGLHAVDHDITVDGYYTNYIDDEYTSLSVEYVEPTPESANYYMWTIGIASVNYEINLTASKYSSLGTYELSMIDFSDGNTIFNVIGFNTDGLEEEVTITDSSSIPKVADSTEEADSTIGLAMKSETTEWTSYGTTKYYKEDGSSYYTGTTSYTTDNQTVSPSLMFYLYHSKNISSDQDLGFVIITLQALVPTNEIEYEVTLVTITVNIDTKDYDIEDAYDASITYSKKYEMPASTSVNITNDSQFTTYFSFFGEVDSQTAIYGTKNDYYRVIVSSWVLPVDTKITMIDYGVDEDNPDFYYLIIDQDLYDEKLEEFESEGEVTYSLSDFIRMDSTSSGNTYSNSSANNSYYHKTDSYSYVMEEFIFIFDFENTEDVGEQTDNSVLFELRADDEEGYSTEILGVLSIRREYMVYSLYESSNSVLSETVSMDTNYVYYDTDKDISYSTTIGYNLTESLQSIIDTNYESSSMGVNITLYDATGTQISSSLLSSTTFTVDGTVYYVDSNGVFRIKLADKVSNISKTFVLNAGSDLPEGTYTMEFSLFASSDGLHNSSGNATIETFEITVVGNENMIVVSTEDTNKLIIGETGLNMDDDTTEEFTITYSSVLENPNIRLAVYKRDTSDSTTNVYNEYDITGLFTDTFTAPSSPLEAQSTYEYIISTAPTEEIELVYNLQSELESGTYKLVFMLYDGNQLIDEDYRYIIVRKDVEND